MHSELLRVLESPHINSPLKAKAVFYYFYRFMRDIPSHVNNSVSYLFVLNRQVFALAHLAGAFGSLAYC